MENIYCHWLKLENTCTQYLKHEPSRPVVAEELLMEPDVLCRVHEEALQELIRTGLISELLAHLTQEELGEAERLLAHRGRFVLHPHTGTEIAGQSTGTVFLRTEVSGLPISYTANSNQFSINLFSYILLCKLVWLYSIM
jgi:hypothetical protein